MSSNNLGFSFDATQVAPNTGPPPPLPDDWYNVIMTDAENKRSKKNQNNAYSELTFKVMDGPYKGRLAWARLNLWNENEQAVDIARGELSAICHATKVMQVQSMAQFFGIPMMIRTVELDPKDGYDAKHEIKGYAAFGSMQSKNAQGIKQEPRNSAAVVPTAPTGAVPTPWGAQPTAPPAPPQAGGPPPAAPWGGAPPVAPAPAPAPPAGPPPGFTPPPPAPAPTAAPPPTQPAWTPPAAPAAGPPAAAPPAKAPWE